ncbi:hypothetical protein RhiirC2_772051 [Rhizophagus irregularis]|uniref:Uncharacterized protein n=1 Tax=Rhizophagus irregularis TaxID=588596 RepID=A0A2N1NSF3_9GLOM|nr:hypothetical protein RhiirC2_772051 [Rhizophagus irregularis]
MHKHWKPFAMIDKSHPTKSAVKDILHGTFLYWFHVMQTLDIDALPDNTVHQFKAILVHYIRKRLPKGYRQLGKQTVSIPATESQFYAVFKNYIHYYSATKGIYKCIFRGGSSNQILANIL